MSSEELENFSAADFVRIKLTNEEKALLREINLNRKKERDNRYILVLEEQQSLLSEIIESGINVNELSDLISRSENYTAIIPILLKHLQKPYSDITKDTIARILAVPEPIVINAWPIIVSEYLKAPSGFGFKMAGDTKNIS